MYAFAAKITEVESFVGVGLGAVGTVVLEGALTGAVVGIFVEGTELMD